MEITIYGVRDGDARDKFDGRPRVIRKVAEATKMLKEENLPRGEKRIDFYLLYADYTGAPGGFLKLELDSQTREVNGFDETSNLQSYSNSDIAKFTREILSSDRTIGVMAMDLRALDTLTHIDGIDKEWVKKYFGIKRELTQSSNL